MPDPAAQARGVSAAAPRPRRASRWRQVQDIEPYSFSVWLEPCWLKARVSAYSTLQQIAGA